MLTLVCGTVVVFGLLLILLVRRLSKVRSLDATISKKLDHLCHLAGLAEIAYENPNLSNRRDRTFSENGFVSKLVDVQHSGKIWLWRSGSTHSIVIRGSHVIDEWLADWELVKATLGWDNEYENIVRKYYNEIDKMVQKEEFDGRVTVVGHSWGASVAEAVYAMLRANKPELAQRFEAVTFDSPGQPKAFRAKYSMTARLPGVYTVNSVANVVNMLHKPCASRFFCCGQGARVTLGLLWSLTVQACRAPFRLVWNNITEHPMATIRTYLLRAEIVEDDPESWPVLSHYALMLFAKRQQGHTTSSSTVFRISAQSSPQPVQLTPPTNLMPLPTDLQKVQKNVPYYVPVGDSQDPLHFWRLFWAGLGESDVVIPLLGVSGVGKTSTIQSILRLPRGTFPTSAGSNNSRHPIVIYWKDNNAGRTYLVDMPGVGAADQLRAEDRENPFIQDDMQSVIDISKGVVGCAAMVVQKNLLTIHKVIYKKLKEARLAVLVCHNVSGGMDTEYKDEIPKYEEHYRSVLGISSEAIVSYSPGKVKSLEDKLDHFVTTHQEHIRREYLAAREARKREEHARRVREAAARMFSESKWRWMAAAALGPAILEVGAVAATASGGAGAAAVAALTVGPVVLASVPVVLGAAVLRRYWVQRQAEEKVTKDELAREHDQKSQPRGH